MHSIAEDFHKNLCFILIFGACDYRTQTACNHLNITILQHSLYICSSNTQPERFKDLRLMDRRSERPVNWSPAAHGSKYGCRPAALCSKVPCFMRPDITHTNKYLLRLLHISTDKLTINPHTSLWWPESLLMSIISTPVDKRTCMNFGSFKCAENCFSHIFFWT